MAKPPGYDVLHQWVGRQLGKPSFCVECGTTEAKVFDWANISGKYTRDLSDWQRMCRSCHLNHDGIFEAKRNKTHCKRGHEYTPENTRLKRTKLGDRNGRECLECQRFHQANYQSRKKQYALRDLKREGGQK